MFLISDFVSRMDILCSKLEVCLPLAYPRTIYKHFSSLKPLTVPQIGSGSPDDDRAEVAAGQHQDALDQDFLRLRNDGDLWPAWK